MRQQPVTCEKILWRKLRNRQLKGLKFKRQFSIGRYIVDFYCAELKLVIEIDGDSHIGKEKYDKERENVLKSYGLKVVRFKDDDVKINFDLIETEFNEIVKDRAEELKSKNPKTNIKSKKTYNPKGS